MLINKYHSQYQSIASLLSQAADCLEALVRIASKTNSTEEEESARQMFETRAQEWFATLHEIQMGLRSAVKNLRKAQSTPLAHDVSSKSSSSMANSYFTSGSASRGHSLTLFSQDLSASSNSLKNTSNGGLMNALVGLDPKATESRSSTTTIQFGQESKLSLSALRFQDTAWKQLANSLSELAASKQVLSSYDSDLSQSTSSLSSNGASSEHTVRGAARLSSTSPSKKQHPVEMNQREKEQLRQRTQDLVSAQASQDSRLLSALLLSTGAQA